VGSLVFSRSARGRPGAHLLLGEGEGLRLAAFVAPLQYAPAQQREFLYLDAVSPNQSEIGPDRKWRAHAIHSYAVECEHAASQILREAGQDELHLCAPSRVTLGLFQRTHGGRHARLGGRRLQVGPYS
jgi:hypothetical protein